MDQFYATIMEQFERRKEDTKTSLKAHVDSVVDDLFGGLAGDIAVLLQAAFDVNQNSTTTTINNQINVKQEDPSDHEAPSNPPDLEMDFDLVEHSSDSDCNCADCVLDEMFQIKEEGLEDWSMELQSIEFEPSPSKRQRTESTTKEQNDESKTRVRTLNMKCFVDDCAATFESKVLMSQHMQKEHDLQLYRCLATGCCRSFDNSKTLARHITDCHSNQQFSCSKCVKSYKTHRQLVQHTLNSHCEGEYYCAKPNCDFAAQYRIEIYRHNYAAHDGSSAKYKCSFEGCRRVFRAKTDLRNHELGHQGAKPFRCRWPLCDLSFETRPNATRHVRAVHFKLPPTLKEIQEQNIQVDPSLNAVDYIEEVNAVTAATFKDTTSKVMKCSHDGCQFTSGTAYELRKHRLEAHLPAQFTCQHAVSSGGGETCGRPFQTKLALSKHRRVDHGLVPFRCKWPGCSYASERKESVISHIRTKHFKLPQSVKEQKRLGIEDDRDPRQYLEVLDDML